MDTLAATASQVRHPLDPLTEAEVAATQALVIGHPAFAATMRFTLVELREPAKPAVLAFQPGQAVVRGSRVVLLDTASGTIVEVLLDLTGGRVADWRVSDTLGQPPIILDEFVKLDRIVKSDARWVAAVKRRGITEADLPLVQVDPFSAGNFGYPEEQGKRLVRAVAYWRGAARDNGYAHPIEGVVAVVDLIGEVILTLVDDPVAIPVPKIPRGYAPEHLPPMRTDLKPLSIVQPEGPSFSVDGWDVTWQNWRFRIGFTPREGLVLHRISLQGQDIARPIIHRASITEMVVPYADPTTNHYWKSAFDAGEYGLGKLANSLELGCDCLGKIHYFDIPAADDFGAPFIMANTVCMHEEDYGTLWKNYEFRNEVREVRRSRRLVISFTAYDPAERFPAGEFPNQHPCGDGLPAWIQANRNIENADIVVWHNFGHTHVCKPEDMPIMPVEYAGFMLKPTGFLSANPAMDLPRDTEGTAPASCCAPSCCD